MRIYILLSRYIIIYLLRCSWVIFAFWYLFSFSFFFILYRFCFSTVRLWTSYVDYQHYVPKPENNKPTYNYNSIEVEFTSDKINGSRESFKIDLKKVLLPYAQTPMEELRANANVRALQEAAMNGAVLEIVLKHPHVM